MLCLAGKVYLAIIRFGYFDVGGRPGKCKNMIKIFATLSQQKGALSLPSSILHFAALAWISWWPTNMQEWWIWPSDDLLECLVMIQLPTNAFIQRQVFHGRPFIRLNLLNTRPQFIATSVCYPSRSLRFPKHKIELGIDLRLVSLNIQALLRAITIISG